MDKNDKIEYSYKILFLGDSTVGKTSLLIRYLEKKFDNSMPTLGVDVRYKYIQYENKNIKLDLWDTAGQERFKSII
jgi:Ras-related protein Rab-18